jgi:glyoxylase-like metal-dependent hydrolase (beta-lactamase superfamily II)
VRELQAGLWWWEARHPEWTAEDDAAGRDWGPEVSSYAVDDGERLLLIDPTTPPSPILDLAADRETIIVLTNPWGHGIELLESWLAEGVTREQVVEGLRPLLEQPIEHVLPTHGPPADRAALERALS